MSDEYETVHIDFEAEDKISPKMSKLERNISKLGASVDNATARFKGMLGQTAMFAGFFALGPAIAGAKHYIDHLDKISDLTGIAADKVGGISNALEDSGVSAGTVENVFAKLVKKGAQLGEGSKQLIKQAKAYGVALKGGPEDTLIAVAGLMEKGKLNAGQMQRVLGVSSSDAADLADALSQGGDALSKKIAEATEKNRAFSDDAMNGWQRFQNASASISTSWHRMTASIMIKLAPALEKIAVKFEHSIDGWAEKAEKFGQFLVDHMDKIIAMAKTYAKLMMVNAAVQKLSGGTGLIGIAGKAAGAYAGRAKSLAAGGAAAGPLSVLGSFLKGAMSLRPIISGMMSLSKLSGIGAIIMVIVGAVKVLGENFNNITTRLKSTFGGVLETVGRIGGKIAALFSEDSGLGQFVRAAGYAFLEVVNKIGEVIQFILNMVEKIIDLIPDVFKSTSDIGARFIEANEANEYQSKIARNLVKRGVKQDSDEWKARMAGAKATADRFMKTGSWMDKVVQATAPVPPAATKKPGTTPENNVYQDFRGSRFDIKQAFAEGYDPDRIAVAFAQDVAALGERKLQSGFAPLFTVSR